MCLRTIACFRVRWKIKVYQRFQKVYIEVLRHIQKNSRVPLQQTTRKRKRKQKKGAAKRSKRVKRGAVTDIGEVRL